MSFMLFTHFFSQLNEPFPSREPLSRDIWAALGVSLFVSAFLYILRPGGLNAPDHLIVWICLGFGLVTFLVSIGFSLVCVAVLKIETDSPRWTLGKWILQCFALITLIAIGNLLFVNAIDDWQHFSLQFFFEMLLYTWIVGIFPIVYFGLTTQLKALEHNLEVAKAINTPYSSSKRVLSENASQTHLDNPEVLDLNLGQTEIRSLERTNLRYAQAMQNYVAVYALEDDELTCILARSTFASCEQELCDERFVRCHRSYLVNLEKVREVSGNAQGLKLFLHDVPETFIPVSRAYIPLVRAALDS